MGWHAMAFLSSVPSAIMLFLVLQVRREKKNMDANLKMVLDNPSMIEKVVRVLSRVDRAKCYHLEVHTTEGKILHVADPSNYEEVETQLDVARMQYALAAA